MKLFNRFFSDKENTTKIGFKSLSAAIKYKIGNYEIFLPPQHALPRFQSEHRLYDKFLPVLAKHIPSDKTVIDIGANVGDTLFSMIQNLDSRYLCIEPSEEFYSYLEKNISLLNDEEKSKIELYKNIIGTGRFSGKIVENIFGTASLQILENETHLPQIIALDKLIKNKEKIILIKVDTDGFDYDVLLSAGEICKISNPILYWENEVQTNTQREGFFQLYEQLQIAGYNHIFIFDNFGNIMIEDCNFTTLKNLTNYVYSMNNQNCTRTIYYNDVLAVTGQNLEIAKNAILEYRKTFIDK